MKQEINGVQWETVRVGDVIELSVDGNIVFVGKLGATRNFIDDLNLMVSAAWYETD